MQAAKSSKMSLEYVESKTTPLHFKFKRDYTDKDGKVQTIEQDFAFNMGFYKEYDGSDGGNAGGAYILKIKKDE